jgi:hypothetical protein
MGALHTKEPDLDSFYEETPLHADPPPLVPARKLPRPTHGEWRGLFWKWWLNHEYQVQRVRISGIIPFPSYRLVVL